MFHLMIRYLFLFLLLLSCCQKTDSASSRTLKINIGKDPLTLDPRKARDLTTITLMRMLFEGLTRASPTGNLELALAEKVDVEQNWTRFTFHLRKSFWSNGDPVTSSDFAASWKTILDPSFPTDIAYQLYVIKNGRAAKSGKIDLDDVGILTPDPQTLIVELEQPTPYFLELVSMTSFFPIPSHRISQNNEWAKNPKDLICNGPFLLTSWKQGDEIQIIKNRKYWEEEKTEIEGIDLFMVSGDTEMRMFEEGKIDWAGAPLSSLPTDALPNLKATNKLQIDALAGTYFFRVNTSDQIKEKKNPLRNPSFRKALALALDRDSIVTHILQGGQESAKSLVPPQMGLSESGYFADHQTELARTLLAKALEELDLNVLEPIVLSYRNSERNTSIVQAIQKQWENGLGIEVQLEAMDPQIFFRRISQKEFQLAASDWVADFNDPINFLEVFKYKDGSTSNTNWESPKYVDLLNQSSLCKDLSERKKLLKEAEEILMDQMPIIPVFHYVLNYLQREGLENVVLSPIGQIDFRWTHLEASPAQ